MSATMGGYTKLFSTILASTIWEADVWTRIVWITMLAMADKDGTVEASVPGLATLARVSLVNCRRALAELSSPDKDSRSPDQGGRRILPIQGGWTIVNHRKYRQKLSAEDRREYKRQKQAEYRARGQVVSSVDVGGQMLTELTHTEAEADTKAKIKSAEAPSVTGDTRSSEIVTRHRSSNGAKSLVGVHHRCPEGTWSACARGICVPAKLYAEWRQQFADFSEGVGAISAFVDRTVAALPDGPIGDAPFDLWRASWRAEHASVAPAKPSNFETATGAVMRAGREYLKGAK